MDSSLIVHEFHSFVEKQPLNTHYQVYTAQDANKSTVHWNIDTPFAGALLDNEVIVEFTLSFNFDVNTGLVTNNNPEDFRSIFGDPTGNQLDSCVPRFDRMFGLKQGFPVTSALANLECVINGQSLHTCPYRYAQEFARFYAHPMEEKGICTMSGGEFDSGTFDSKGIDNTRTLGNTVAAVGGSFPLRHPIWGPTLAAGSVDNVNNILISDTELFTNQGWHRRVEKMTKRWMDSGQPQSVQYTHNNHFSREFNLTVYERLPLSPFLTWEAKDGKRSIPYVDKMEITMLFYADAAKKFMQGRWVSADSMNTNIIWWGDTAANKPKLHLKWYIPPPGMVMKPEVHIPVSVIKESPRQLDVTISTSSTVAGAFQKGDLTAGKAEFTYENLRLQQIPDLLWVFIKPTSSGMRPSFTAEHHLSIRDIEITINGDSGKVIRANEAQLFAMYVRNSPMAKERLYDFDQWRKYYCTCVFTPADLGVRVPPGINHGVTLDVRLNYSTAWLGRQTPTGANQRFTAEGGLDTAQSYDVIILSVYDKYMLTLTNHGNASLMLQNVPSLDLPHETGGIDKASLRANFA